MTSGFHPHPPPPGPAEQFPPNYQMTSGVSIPSASRGGWWYSLPPPGPAELGTPNQHKGQA